MRGCSTPFTPAGGLTVDFVALLLLGRERGYLTPDDLMAVLESVELTPALIDAVVGRVRAEGIEWRDDTEGDADSEPVRCSASVEPDADGDVGAGPSPPRRSLAAAMALGRGAPMPGPGLAQPAARAAGPGSVADLRIDVDSRSGRQRRPGAHVPARRSARSRC